jgi:hypothetical protein
MRVTPISFGELPPKRRSIKIKRENCDFLALRSQFVVVAGLVCLFLFCENETDLPAYVRIVCLVIWRNLFGVGRLLCWVDLFGSADSVKAIVRHGAIYKSRSYKARFNKTLKNLAIHLASASLCVSKTYFIHMTLLFLKNRENSSFLSMYDASPFDKSIKSRTSSTIFNCLVTRR